MSKPLLASLGVLCLLLLIVPAVVRAAEASGLKPGESLPAFVVEKVAGNAEDGVEAGKSLCYRCKLGGRPVVTVFSRSTAPNVASLMKALDGAVAAHADAQAAAFVNLLGDDAESLKSSAPKLVEASGAKNIAVVVPRDHAAGPDGYNLNPKVEVTVLVYKDGKVTANHALSAAELDAKAIAAIVADTDKLFE